MTAATSDQAQTTTHTDPESNPNRPWGWVVGCLAAAWVIPLITHLIGLDLLLVPLIILATASLLRTGRTLVDRLLIASALLVAVATVAGLLFSLWPWGLAPVPAAGLAGTILVAVAVFARRGPELRLPFHWTDLVVIGASLVAAAVTGIPLLREDFQGRLALVLQGEDLSRHFSIFDLMTREGGYLYLKSGTEELIDPGLVGYPQGSHLFTALLDSFARSGDTPPTVFAAFTGYLWWNVLIFALFAAAVVWGLRWIGDDLLRGWWAPPVLTLGIAVVCFGSLFTLVIRGYPSELTGLALFAVAVALAVRPPSRRPSMELLLLIGVLFVGVMYTYYFLAPVLAIVIAWWAIEHDLRSRWRFAGVLGGVIVVLSAIPVLVNDASNPTEHLLHGGPVVEVDRMWLFTLLVPLGAAAVLGGLWHNYVWRTLGVGLAAALLFAGGIGGYQMLRDGMTYYFEKALHIVLVLGVMGLGIVGVLLQRLTVPLRRLARPATIGVSVIASLGVLAAFQVLEPSTTRTMPRTHLPTPYPTESWGRAYFDGVLTMGPEAQAVLDAIRGEEQGPEGRMVLFWGAFNRGTDFYVSQYAAALQRHFDGPTYAAMVQVPRPRSLEGLENLLDSLEDTPVKMITRDPVIVEFIEEYAEDNPEADIQIAVLPPLPEDSIDPVPPPMTEDEQE